MTTTPLRVLMVEDSPTDAKLVMRELKKMSRPVEIERVENAAAMRRALGSQRWDVIVSDWSLPTFSAPAALSVVKELQLDVPFIIVSGTIGEEVAVEAIRTGAQDYVLKDRLGRLNPAIERVLRESEERKALQQAQTALRESEARFARLADSGIVGIVYADVFGRTFDANETYLRMLGYTREEVTSAQMSWAELTPPEWAASDEAAVALLKESGTAHPWEKELFRKDGSRVPVLMGVAMLDYPKCIVFIADLTAQKRAEDARAELLVQAQSAHAGRARAEQALKQSEEQLRHAQKMEAVGRLAGGVAHDFNNVLSVIMGYGELLLSDLKQGDPLRSDIDEICKAATHAAGLTRQLLLFSRQQVPETKVVDLGEVVLGMEKMLRRIVGEDIQLACSVTRPLGRVRVDPGHIEQVVMNLAVNARDAMPTGGKLAIETASVLVGEDNARSHLPAGRHVMLSVTDTGIGIDKATQERIFDPFFTTKEKGRGTGLGLSTVFGIVQQSGGTVLVDSAPGKGASFKIYLPHVDAELEHAAPATIVPTSLRGNETILVVEDEEQVRNIVITVLRKHGYRVFPAQNAGDALLLCEKQANTFHLLLTDVVMPQMSGPELAKRLALLCPDMKVLFMSGYIDDSVVRHGAIATGAAFLHKPFTPASLTRKVREVLEAPGRDGANTGERARP